MRTHLAALAATLGIAGLTAVSLSGAAVASVNGTSSLGSVSTGGGGAHGGGGGGSGGAHGGGGSGGGHSAAGGHFAGGHSGGGYRGGTYGGPAGFAAHASFMAHGGYVAHGSSGYRIVGYQSAAPARVGAAPHAARGARMALALGPRIGSAASARRLDHMAHGDRMHPRPRHPGHPGYPRHPHYVRIVHAAWSDEYEPETPMFCSTVTFLPPGKSPHSGCLTPIKARVLRAR